MVRELNKAIGLLLAVGALMNGIYMLTAPESWYFAVPGVTTTGPFNQHFLRDIGIIFLFIGAAFLVGTFRESQRTFLWGAATLWLACHATFHVWEVMVGICGASALMRDFAAVSLPAILGAGITLSDRSERAAARRVP